MARVSTLISAFAILGTSQAIRFLGRVNPATRELTWPATGLSFSFTGTSASVGVTSISGTNSVELLIDGSTPIIIENVNGTSISTPSLVRGQHTVQIRKRSETVYGTFALGDVKIFRGSLGADSVSRRRIQIIGDSISVGYGLDGTYPCTNSAFLENAPKTYGALTAKSLSAEYDILAWSGIGLIRNTIGSSDPVLMPQLWTRYGTNDADNSYMFPRAETPDIVVINLGTNDFSYLGVRDPVNATMLTDSMIAFAETIRSHYPKAELFLTSSPMLSDTYPTTQDAQHTTHVNVLKAAAEKLGSKAHVVDFPAQGSEVGCDYHPNAAEHEKLAAILTSAIKEVMW
ncbi:unnamed protein product [Clonostachys rosea f. rosea IK726]|uniref:SGNH hydrolase-type esterase domain-containing protein n=2 Tax=Bionectria ochroleuca TaxID=29856 RepID=A0A8H7N5Z6_BIOOC|nr:unnamed protein product [Clonostachys rosea f. rosea IK726]